jgi:fermentation-respiration switch protein FrsA (DUF1100 family)
MIFRSALVLATVGIGWIAGLGMNLVDRFIFFPDSALLATPAELALPYEDVHFTAPDGPRLHGWWVPGRRQETLLWLHGNAGNISHRLENLRLLHDHVGANVFIFDYRQYGQSEGTASESGLYADARGALSYVQGRSDVAADRVIYFGRSLGSAVAIDLAAEHEPRGLVLETPFVSVREMAKRMLPGPLSVVVPTSFDNFAKISGIACPKLFLHGDRDEIVPYEHGRRLFEAATPPKAFFTIRGATHNDTYIVGGARYFAQIADFLDKLGDAR